MKYSFVFALGILGYLAMGSQPIVFAAPPGHCAEDRQKFCKDVKLGAGRVFQCLEHYKNQLSETCKKHINIMSQEFEELTEACSADLSTYCGQIKAGQDRGFACLKGNDDRLSAACREVLRRIHEDAE